MKNDKLIEELTFAGASASEASKFAEFANTLTKPFFERNISFKNAQADIILSKLESKKKFDLKRFLIPAGIAVSSVSLVGASAFAAQSSLPGDPLYSLKKISEKIFQTVDPKFSEQISMRRSVEIKQLVEKKGTQNLIKQTIKDYQETKKESPKSNNSRLIQDNLKQAEEKASGETKAELKQVLEENKVKGEIIHEKTNDKGKREEKLNKQKLEDETNN